MRTEAIIAGADRVVRLQAVELPKLTPTRVHLRALLSGVSCGTEADAVTGRARYISRPFLSGYQVVAEVVACGALVRGLHPGDQVFTRGGELWGMPHLFGGSHARELVVEEQDVIRLNLEPGTLGSAAYAALGAVGLEGLQRMALEPGRTLLVFGLGMLGQLVGRLAQLAGLRVVGVNRSVWKREVALAMGFDAVCAPDPDGIDAAVARLGLGPVRWAVDTTGQQAVFDLAVRSLGRNGELNLLGYYPEPFRIDFDQFHARDLRIHNPVGWGERIPAVLRAIGEGRLNLAPLIRRNVKPEGITAFYRELVEDHSSQLGVVIDWR